MNHVTVSTLLVLAVPGVPSPAQHSFNFEFEQNGILPSADPNIAVHNNTGFIESSLYFVSGGLLQQRTRRINGNISYSIFEQGVPRSIRFSPSLHTVLEARLKVLDINGQAGSFFQASDGMHRYGAWFTPTGVDILTPSEIKSVPVDVFQFHTYRIESPANSDVVTLFVDDVQVFSDTAAATGLFFANWGDGKTAGGNGADTDWEYVRFTNGAATYSAFGQGCSGTAGTPELTSGSGQSPLVGEPFEVQVANVLPGNLAFLVVGFSNTASDGLPLPFDLGALAMPGCTQYVSLDFGFGAPSDQTGTASWSLPLCNCLSLVGVEFYLQGAALDAAANPLGAVVSNAVHGVIGLH